MPFLEWNDNLLTGVAEIDKQHKNIFKYLNSIYEYNKINQGNKEVIKKVYSLLDFIFQHFDFEEALIEEYNSPHGEDHKKEHAYFKETIKEIFEKFGDSPYALTFEFCKFVMEFYPKHITFFDKILVRDMNKHSL